MSIVSILKQVPKLPSLGKRPYNKPAKEPEWKTIHRLADEQRTRWESIFISSVEAVKAVADQSVIREGLASGNFNEAMSEIDWTPFAIGVERFKEAALDLVLESGNEMIRHLPPDARQAGFDETSPRITEFVTQEAEWMIDQVRQNSEAAVYESTKRAHLLDFSPDYSAELITEMIGLTPREAQAVDNFKRTMLDRGRREGKVYHQSILYAVKHLQLRAERIAGTETIRYANFGWLEVIRQAEEAGLLGTALEWIVTPDDRLCPYCRELDGQQVDIGQRFVSSLESVISPPLHVNCRCSLAYIE